MVLINTETGEKYKGIIEKISPTEILRLKKNPNFTFDWPIEKENAVYKIHLKDQEEILGLISLIDIPKEFRIHINLIESSIANQGRNKRIKNIPGCLIAFTCKNAFKKGYDGFVSLIPKTKLVEHYHIRYGFIQVGNQMAVFGESSKLLIEKYIDHEEI